MHSACGRMIARAHAAAGPQVWTQLEGPKCGHSCHSSRAPCNDTMTSRMQVLEGAVRRRGTRSWVQCVDTAASRRRHPSHTDTP
eukprot:162387-Chlamydomonas_euryale.AAC.1